MRKRIGLLLSVLALGCVAVSCGPGIRAPQLPNGKKVMLQIHLDRGLEGKTQDQQNQHNQLGDFIERDLMARARDFGYDAKMIPSPDAYAAGPDSYLLKVKVTNYNPGSKAARMLVGFGAGSASLDEHYELITPDGKPIIVKDHGKASGKDWSNICRRLNQDMLIVISQTLTTP